MSTTTPPPTPETDALAVVCYGEGGIEASYGFRAVPIKDCRKLERERDEAREQLEREQMRLVACDVVAMSDTESSRGPARDMHKDYWSAAVESVIRRVDECIELRKQLEAAHVVLDADPSKIIRNAKDGYPEGRESQELTLAERVKALCIYAADWERWYVEAEKRSEAMREAIKEAHRFIRNIVTNHECGSIVDAHGESVLTKLKPFIKP